MSPFIHMSGSLPTITIPTSLLVVETQVISIPTQSFHTSSLICCLAERPLIIARNTSKRVIPRNWTTPYEVEDSVLVAIVLHSRE
ncbi:hypothetical protein CDAR_366511 [Caerostris darwini]|uniref:Uncharacterized protein n=1 Tax=Caerostris darwini TaxID=1538125 RepID=A0AAV4Q3Q6_9ARAC|nr:hypothetical protein CDAR_366511 [Caerostris darwini]